MDPRWHVNIVAHDRVHEAMYRSDPKWNPDHFRVINVSERPLAMELRCPVINQLALPESRKLGREWAESEAIYNYYRNGLHADLDYVGFIHYDMELQLRGRRLSTRRRRTNITDRIDRWVVGRSHGHISFESHSPRVDYGQRILADFSQPNVLVGVGVNCYDKIPSDYNEYFTSDVKIDDFDSRPQINLCSSFLIDTPTFARMMAFFEWVLETRDLHRLDEFRLNRLQGGLAERYFGVFMLFEYAETLDLSLVHHNLKDD